MRKIHLTWKTIQNAYITITLTYSYTYYILHCHVIIWYMVIAFFKYLQIYICTCITSIGVDCVMIYNIYSHPK